MGEVNANRRRRLLLTKSTNSNPICLYDFKLILAYWVVASSATMPHSHSSDQLFESTISQGFPDFPQHAIPADYWKMPGGLIDTRKLSELANPKTASAVFSSGADHNTRWF